MRFLGKVAIVTGAGSGIGKCVAERFLGQAGAAHPLGRVGEPGEVAAMALFLASDASAWTTGAVVTVDGGISLA